MMRALLFGAAIAFAAPALAEAPAVDQARLKVAASVAGRLLPDGTYQKLMGGSMNQMMQSMMGEGMNIPIRSLAQIGGLSDAQVKALGPGTIKEVSEILDPAFDQRMRVTMQVMMSSMGRFFTQFEPSLREGLAEALAVKFSEAQLKEIDGFYASPTGTAFAAQYMTIMAEPAVMSRIQAMMPKMMDAMPAIFEEAGKATAQLPKARKFQDLSDAEKERVAKLMGIDPAKVKS